MTTQSGSTWGFLTNHALMLTFVVTHPECTVRQISDGVGVTERATLSILRQLSDEQIVERHKAGRRNTYAVNFGHLAAYRREGTVALTPRLFVDGLIQTMLDLSGPHPATNGNKPPERVDSGAVDPRIGRWGFFTNHALLLLSIAMDNSSTVREMAMNVGVTERAIVAILNQLENDGIILRHREGRRNAYSIEFEALRRFPRWSGGTWHVPAPLVDMAVSGLKALGGG